MMDWAIYHSPLASVVKLLFSWAFGMKVFRPYIGWRRPACALDDGRLGKQKVEAKQVVIEEKCCGVV